MVKGLIQTFYRPAKEAPLNLYSLYANGYILLEACRKMETKYIVRQFKLTK